MSVLFYLLGWDVLVFFFKQKTAYEMRISGWSSDVCSSDLGNRALVTDVLKGRLGFDGLVVSDWNAIEQVDGCTKSHCPQAVNAGIDLIMVPDDWKAFIDNTVADVESGAIPMARIDDAVTRIIRVKLRTGLFERSPVPANDRSGEIA